MRTFATPARKRSTIRAKGPGRRFPVSSRVRDTSVQQTAIRRILHGPRLQPKLAFRAPDDAYEREADRVAEAVMCMPTLDGMSESKGFADGTDQGLQRRCSACEEQVQQQPFEENDGPMLQTKSNSGDARTVTPAIESQVRSLPGAGQPLSSSTRAFFEPRFGHDFSDVRVHTGSQAGESARALRARAYALGRDIVMGAGEFSPDTSSGKRLLAHELTHTIQQSGRGKGHASRLIQRLGDPAHIPADMGCPDATTDELRSNDLQVDFAVGGSTLMGTAPADIAAFATAWTAAGSVEDLVVHGFASPDGAEGPNWQLSCDRAMVVRTALISNGVPANRIIALAHGETNAFGGSNDPNRTAVVTRVPTTPVAVPTTAAGPNLGTCATHFTGVTFALANQTASGRSPGAGRSGLMVGGNPGIRITALGPVVYEPDVTITVPTPLLVSASDFEIGLIGNLLASTREFTYSSGHVLRRVVPFFPIKDGVSATHAQFDSVFLRTGPRIRFDFVNSGDTVSLRMDDAPGDFAFLNVQDNPSCPAGLAPATLTNMTINDSFRTWVAARHRPSGCVLALHHVDWNSDWQLDVTVGSGGVTATFTTNAINVTQANGNGRPAFVSGSRVPNDLNTLIC